MMSARRQIFIKIDVLVWNIDEVKRGDTVKYDSVEDMMRDLKA